MTGLVLGLDVGSSVAKAGLYDDNGREVATAAAPVALDRSRAGRVEFDPLTVQATVGVLIGRVSDSAGIAPTAIRGVGIAAAMVGGVLVDAQNRPLRAGINWEDARAQSLIDRMQARDPHILSHIFHSSGCVLQQGCSLPVLAALAEEEPASVARAHAFISLKDHLRAWLTGRIGADCTEAAVAPGSAAARDRASWLITAFGLDALAHLLPTAEPSQNVGGHVTPKAAATTGLRPGTPVAVGAGDVPCMVLGAGGALAGRSTVILGTTAMVGVTHAAPRFTPPDLGLLFTLPGAGWFRAMVNVAGTLNLDWAVRLLLPDLEGPAALSAFETLARQSPPGANGVVFLPYLSDSGIIAPTIDPMARAAFGGLAPRHGRADLARAVYEGVAHALTELLVLTGASGDTISLVGGGARSGLWPQMIADFSGRQVILPEGREFGARGAALLARVALGDLVDMEAAAGVAPAVRQRLTPDPSLAVVAAEGRQRLAAFRGG
jgi:sugar (pentulose or hexulose) kinase